jgi:hypothetical protein
VHGLSCGLWPVVTLYKSSRYRSSGPELILPSVDRKRRGETSKYSVLPWHCPSLISTNLPPHSTLVVPRKEKPKDWNPIMKLEIPFDIKEDIHLVKKKMQIIFSIHWLIYINQVFFLLFLMGLNLEANTQPNKKGTPQPSSWLFWYSALYNQ